MRRFLVLACLLGAATAYSVTWNNVFGQGRTNHRHKVSKVSAAGVVREIQTDLFELALKMRRFCVARSDRALNQAFTSTHYTLTANLTGCSEDGLKVRAGQRLIAIQVRDSRCKFITLQLLPNVVDATSAFWRFKKEQLTIYIPYDLEYGRCGRAISDRVHTVPKFEEDVEDPDIDVRFQIDSSEELSDLID